MPSPYDPCLPHLADPQQEPEKEFYCPVCGRAVFEDVFIDQNTGLVIGCDQCVETKKREDVLDAE